MEPSKRRIKIKTIDNKVYTLEVRADVTFHITLPA